MCQDAGFREQLLEEQPVAHQSFIKSASSSKQALVHTRTRASYIQTACLLRFNISSAVKIWNTLLHEVKHGLR